MNEVIESIEDALDKECWIPALALALTLPDTCGSIEYPEMINNKGRRLSKRQYLAWFKEHVEHRFADHTGFDDKGNALRPYFNADMCYQLRCAILHSSNDDIDFEYGDCKKEFEYHYDFELRVNACDSYGEIWASGANANERARLIHVCIDVKNLCVALCEEALTYLHTVKKEQLANRRVRIVDVAKYCQLIDDTRRNSS